MNGNAKLGSFGALGSSDDRITRDFSQCAQLTLGQLRQLFPKTFNSVRPLKIGITQDIIARTSLNSEQVCEFMRFYCATRAYLHASLRTGAVRYDLDGKRVGAVSPTERMHATFQLEEQARQRQASKRERAFRAALLEPTVISDEDRP